MNADRTLKATEALQMSSHLTNILEKKHWKELGPTETKKGRLQSYRNKGHPNTGCVGDSWKVVKKQVIREFSLRLVSVRNDSKRLKY